MKKYTVKEITKQDTLTIVQLEPQKGVLLLEDENPPGCMQHIITYLSRYGKESEEQCNRMCEMLCKIDLDDDSSRKSKPQTSFFCQSFLADNKDTFRRYKGVEVLIETIRKHKSTVVTKALIHVLTGNSKTQTLS